MNEVPLEEGQVQLTNTTRIEVDKMNIKLLKQYQKREGRGKNAPLIDLYDYGNPTYYGNLEALGNRLVDKEFMEGLTDAVEIHQVESIKAMIDYAIEHINNVKQEVKDHIKENIVIDLGIQEKKKTTKKIKGQLVEID